jgi:peptidylprolyl isomerase
MIEKITNLTLLKRISLVLFLIVGLILINGYGKDWDTANGGEKELGKGIQKGIVSQKVAVKRVVKKGDRVKVEYTGILKDGTIFDKSKTGKPLEFTVGSGQIIPGFDKAVEGMKLNEEKRVTIKAEDAYGKRDESLVREFPKKSLPKNFNPKKGMVVGLRDQNGRLIPRTVKDVTEKSIIIDFNHPLAGKDLTFNIKVVDIEQSNK